MRLFASENPNRGRALGVLLTAALLGGGAAAQGLGPVTLVFDNGLGSESLSGTLTEFDGDRFLLDSPIGLVAIPVEGVSCIGDACPPGTAPEVASAPEITSAELVLTSHDGTSVIRGDLLKYVDETYVLATNIGEMHVPAMMVRCEGSACMTPASASAPRPGGPARIIGNGMSIEGTMLAVEDGIYVLEVVGFGELRVPIADYACEGPGCP